MPSDGLDVWGSRFISWPYTARYEQVTHWLEEAAVFPVLGVLLKSWVFWAYISICLTAESISSQKLNSFSIHTYVHLYVTFKNWKTELALLFFKTKAVKIIGENTSRFWAACFYSHENKHGPERSALLFCDHALVFWNVKKCAVVFLFREVGLNILELVSY